MKNGNLETLEEAVKEMIRHIRILNGLEHDINERWGVKLACGMIPSNIDHAQGEVVVKRGIEELEKVFGKEAKSDDLGSFYRMKELRHNGVRFVQYADDKTKTFVKAFKEPPKVRIVEDDDE